MPFNPEASKVYGDRNPPRDIWYELDAALNLLAVLEDARDAAMESRHLTVVLLLEDEVRELSRNLDFEDPEGDADAS